VTGAAAGPGVVLDQGMQTWEAITSRRNVRSFADTPVSPDDLRQILEAGRRSPSSRNSQPWDFVVVRERGKLVQLAEVGPGAGPVASAAVAVALVTADEPARRVQFDLGQATMCMMLAAADLGIGSGHVGVADRDLAAQVLALPPGRSCGFLIACGYPAGRPLAPIRRPDRRPFDQVVHWDTW
jgi:nitroreductase